MLSFIVFVLTALEVLTALLLIGIILIQQSKAGGGLGAVGGGVTETMFGATAGNVLTRGTVILASVFFVVTLLLAIVTGQGQFGKSVADGLSVEADAPAAVTTDTEKATEQAEPAEAPDVEDDGAAATTEAQSETAKPAAAAKDDGAKTPDSSSEPKSEGGGE